MKDRLRQGTLYIGSSAGAVVVCPDISFIREMDDPSAANLTDHTGMGLVECAIVPHLDHPDMGPMAQDILARANPGQRMIGLRDDQAIIIRNSDIEIV